MAAHVNVSTIADAPREVAWEILADFPNVADYTDSVKVSESTSEVETGVGATRHCVMAPMGTTEERIIGFEPNEKLVVSLYGTTGMPVKESESTFAIEEVADGRTRITFDANVKARGGPLAGIIGRRLQKRLPKGAQRLVDDLAAAAEQRAAEREAATRGTEAA